ncbi:hypothetical protein BDK51DRAFT_44886 [Blyttiomyces helicus]|uniref:UBA domain-containing protein n=1 Tax=Blyttiomyces helicus TaxID=388810 RepID=A0A4P9WNV6_9FUNG|nr:hypothetical protein BDK51DRAFT_44886 [Blyttiomyces helicus]|eukprot:RKO92880.1 hypothetical protein BDK51DRAFT_44886 [Blyttiomyces helicus]
MDIANPTASKPAAPTPAPTLNHSPTAISPPYGRAHPQTPPPDPYALPNVSSMRIESPYSSPPPAPLPPPKPAGLVNSQAGGGRPGVAYPSLHGASPAYGAQGEADRGVDVGAIPGNVPVQLRGMYTNYVQMGFTGEAVSRGLAVHGSNEKKMLDFVIAFQTYRNEGYSLSTVEAALQAYGDDSVACKRFLESHAALEELGFPPERIAEALVLKKNDRDAALDWLVSAA